MKKHKGVSLTRYFFTITSFWVILLVVLVLAVNFALMRDTSRIRLNQDLLNTQEQINQLLATEAKVLGGYTVLLDQSNLISSAAKQKDTRFLSSHIPALLKNVRAFYPPLSSIEVTDRSGTLLFYTDVKGNFNSGRPRSPSLQDALFTGKPQSGIEHILSSGQIIFEFTSPLFSGNEIVGFIKTQATPAEFIPNIAKALGVDLALMTRRDVVGQESSSKKPLANVKRTMVATSLTNWKARLIMEMMVTDMRTTNLEGIDYVFNAVPLRFNNKDVPDAEVLIVVDKSSYPNLFSQQLIIFLAIGGVFILALNLLLFRLMRRYVWHPLKRHTATIKTILQGDFSKLTGADTSLPVREFDELSLSIEQMGTQTESLIIAIRGCSNEFSEQSNLLKEYSDRLTSSISQVAEQIRTLSDSSKECQVTIKEVPMLLFETSKILTDASLDARGTTAGTAAIKRQCEALRKIANSFNSKD